MFSNDATDCSAYIGSYSAMVTDIGNSTDFVSSVEITANGDGCTITSNSIPNHDFNDAGAFANAVAEVTETFNLPVPEIAAQTTALSLATDNAIFLNGVKLDQLAAACYGVGNEPLGQEKIGCMQEGQPWRYDPMSPNNSFGTDSNNAHTQPDGAYHYHGDPNSMYDDTGDTASGLIGFAADGHPIFGPYIDDNGNIRKATSGWELKSGDRVSQAGEGAFPGGQYDGTYIDDYEFTGNGDLDECNGREVNGVYRYHVTDSYPWVVGCYKGTPDASFNKR